MTSRGGSVPERRGEVNRLPRSNATACYRCRSKKKRCDNLVPQCTLCRSVGAECVSWDAVAQRQVPRSYVQSLEDRIAHLESKLLQYGHIDQDSDMDLRSAPSPISTTRHRLLNTAPQDGALDLAGPQSGTEADDTAIQAILDDVTPLTINSIPKETTFSSMMLAKLTRPKTCTISEGNEHSTFHEDDVSADILSDVDIAPVVMPTEDGASALVKVYFQFANLSLPLLHEPTFSQQVQLLQSLPRIIDMQQTHTTTQSRMALFFVFEVFAIALLTLQKQDPASISISSADRYHRLATAALLQAGLPDSLEGIQALLLLAQYSYHHPTAWAVWQTVGAALRLAVEMGLHQDSAADYHDPLALDIKRRTFWVAYAMDRNIAIALDLPSTLSDGAISAKFPSCENDEFITRAGIIAPGKLVHRPKLISLHVLRFRQIQSEMQVTLNESPRSSGPSMDLVAWQRQMRQRIQEWYEEMPTTACSKVEKRVLENFELTYHRLLFYLYHPSTNIPSPSEEAHFRLADAAASMIRLYRRFFPERRLTIFWQATTNLSAAGTALMHSYVLSAQVQARFPLRELENLIHACSSVLWGMVEHFPSAKGKRDAFDALAGKVIAELHTRASSTQPSSPEILSSAAVPKAGPGINSILPIVEATTPLQAETASASHDQHGAPLELNGVIDPPLSVPFSVDGFDEGFWELFNNMDEVLEPAWS